MKSNQYPVVINGKGFLIDRTFDGSPAVYRIRDSQTIVHIDGGTPIYGGSLLEGADKSQVLIFARLAPEPGPAAPNPLDTPIALDQERRKLWIGAPGTLPDRPNFWVFRVKEEGVNDIPQLYRNDLDQEAIARYAIDALYPICSSSWIDENREELKRQIIERINALKKK